MFYIKGAVTVIEEKKDAELIRLIELEKKKGLCIHNFRCQNMDPSSLGPVAEMGLSKYVDALCDSMDCEYALTFGEGRLCRCPVRIYIAHKYEK